MICSICTEPNSNDISESEKVEELTTLTIQLTTTKLYKNEQILALHTEPKHMLIFEIIQNTCHNDLHYQQLLSAKSVQPSSLWLQNSYPQN